MDTETESPIAATNETFTYDMVPVGQIEPSPFNHRKIFRGLDELGESLKSKGMINPITVRWKPSALTPKPPYEYELVAGERRWRAAQLVGMERVPAIVRHLTDLEVLEIQLVENVQRADVHPLEEADGYKALIDDHGYDVDAIAAKTGKSKASVYARLKLTELTGKAARDAFLEDKINASIALLIARIPDKSLQDRAAKEILAGDDRDRQMVHGEWVDVERPMSYREAQLHLQANYMLRLDCAPFKIDDAELVKSAGACTGCVYRTGNQPDLFGDVSRADVCTNPPCFQKKRDAQYALDAKAHQKAGNKVLTATDAKKIFDERTWGDEDEKYYLGWESPYVDAEDNAPFDVDSKRRPWSELFGGEDKVPIVLAKDPGGTAWKLIDKKAARTALEKSGVLKAPKKSKSRDSNKKREPTAAELAEPRIRKAVIEAMVAKLDPKAATNDLAFWKWLTTSLLAGSFVYGEGGDVLATIYKVENRYGGRLEKALLKPVKTMADYRRLAIEMLLADRIGGGVVGSEVIDKGTKEACKTFGVDWEELESDVTEAVKAELTAKAEKSKAKPATKKPAKPKKGAKS